MTPEGFIMERRVRDQKMLERNEMYSPFTANVSVSNSETRQRGEREKRC